MTSYVEALSVCIPMQKFQNMAVLHEYVLDPYFFNLILWIDLCDKKNLTFIDRCDEKLFNSSDPLGAQDYGNSATTGPPVSG